MIKNLGGMKRNTCMQNSQTLLTKFIPASQLGISAATREEGG
jgi:hypothetical protein